MSEAWSIVVERLDMTGVFDSAPVYVESESYRRYEVMPYGLLPLTDDEWERGHFEDVTPFGIVGQRHYLRVMDGADA
jgi:hypothetical protein